MRLKGGKFRDKLRKFFPSPVHTLRLFSLLLNISFTITPASHLVSNSSCSYGYFLAAFQRSRIQDIHTWSWFLTFFLFFYFSSSFPLFLIFLRKKSGGCCHCRSTLSQFVLSFIIIFIYLHNSDVFECLSVRRARGGRGSSDIFSFRISDNNWDLAWDVIHSFLARSLSTR